MALDPVVKVFDGSARLIPTTDGCWFNQSTRASSFAGVQRLSFLTAVPAVGSNRTEASCGAFTKSLTNKPKVLNIPPFSSDWMLRRVWFGYSIDRRSALNNGFFGA